MKRLYTVIILQHVRAVNSKWEDDVWFTFNGISASDCYYAVERARNKYKYLEGPQDVTVKGYRFFAQYWTSDNMKFDKVHVLVENTKEWLHVNTDRFTFDACSCSQEELKRTVTL